MSFIKHCASGVIPLTLLYLTGSTGSDWPVQKLTFQDFYLPGLPIFEHFPPAFPRWTCEIKPMDWCNISGYLGQISIPTHVLPLPLWSVTIRQIYNINIYYILYINIQYTTYTTTIYTWVYTGLHFHLQPPMPHLLQSLNNDTRWDDSAWSVFGAGYLQVAAADVLKLWFSGFLGTSE